MRVNRKDGSIHLSRTDTKRWHSSPAFREEIGAIATELLQDVNPTVGVHGWISCIVLIWGDGVVLGSLYYQHQKKKPQPGEG